jgi:HEAT repeat protein
MTRARTFAAAIAIASVAALATLAGAAAPMTDREWVSIDTVVTNPTAIAPGDELRDELGGVDYVPTREALDAVIGEAPALTLIALATADDGELDPGVRLRALRALEHYPGNDTELALTTSIESLAGANSGIDTLYLRAALAVVAGEDAIEIVAPSLGHANKDVRAAAATALGATGSADAKPWLYERLEVEDDAMVELAISAAIRALGERME